ncbi:hypothetical protein SLT36_25665 [Aminobacter sp. BA135]|uniref:hypothetical protein n=1 Tax=Aminobacter sp. BA135 TaxID=537596 RepID=UPI003D79F717
MTTGWPDRDRTTIDRYLASFDQRSIKSQICYRQASRMSSSATANSIGRADRVAAGIGRMLGSDVD